MRSRAGWNEYVVASYHRVMIPPAPLPMSAKVACCATLARDAVVPEVEPAV